MTKLLVLTNEAARSLAERINLNRYPSEGTNIGAGIHAPVEMRRTERECELVVCGEWTVVRLSEETQRSLTEAKEISLVDASLSYSEDTKQYVLINGDVNPLTELKESIDARGK